MSKENIFYILIVVLAIGLLLYGVWYTTYKGTNYQKAISSENKQDICATPQGYTDEEWKEHMSHHPDRYKDCLGG